MTQLLELLQEVVETASKAADVLKAGGTEEEVKTILNRLPSPLVRARAEGPKVVPLIQRTPPPSASRRVASLSRHPIPGNLSSPFIKSKPVPIISPYLASTPRSRPPSVTPKPQTRLKTVFCEAGELRTNRMTPPIMKRPPLPPQAQLSRRAPSVTPSCQSSSEVFDTIDADDVEALKIIVSKGRDCLLKAKSEGCSSLLSSFHSTTSLAVNQASLPPLIYAAKLGSIRCLSFLLKLVNPDLRGPRNLTALHLAKTIACVKVLMEAKADPTLVDFSGRSPLHHAAKYGDLEICEFLVHATGTAGLRVRDCDGRLPIDIAIGMKHEHLRSLLLFGKPEVVEHPRKSIIQYSHPTPKKIMRGNSPGRSLEAIRR